MKKALLLSVLLLLIIGQLMAQDLGDVNDDGSINVIDALLIAQYYVGLNPPAFDVSPADVNLDGDITIVDALLVARYYVGLITELPPPGTTTIAPTDAPEGTPTPGVTETPEPTGMPGECIICIEPTIPPGYTPAPTTEPYPLGTPPPIMAPRAGLFTFTTSRGVVKVCEIFTTSAYLNSGTSVLTSYQVTISYDYPTIQVRDCLYYNGVIPGADGFVTNADISSPGTIVITGYDAAGTGPGTRLHLFDIAWRAIPFETPEYDDYVQSYINMSVDSILDENGEPFGEPGVDRRYGPIIVYTGKVVPPNPW